KKLATMVCQLMQFQEDTLGKESNFKRQPKLPASLLRDFNPRGALYVIAAKCDDIMAARDLKRIDWTNPAKRKENMEILIGIRKELESEGLLRHPVVGADPGLGLDLVCKLGEAVRKMGGTVVDNPGECFNGVSVYGCMLLYLSRIFRSAKQMRAGDMALVHWTQLPDSYDEWVLARHAPPAGPLPPSERSAAWRVYPRWVKDSELYNEWMNPADYIAD
ncbi:hypothetical protein VOLCADRAFT_31937, partial [Volvox carteri f. nagariensis]